MLTLHGMQVVLKMMQQPLPQSATDTRTSSKEQLERSPWWLLRKWLLRLAYRLADRYGDPKIIKVETSQPFASLFLAEFSNDYLQVRASTPCRYALILCLDIPVVAIVQCRMCQE